MLACSTASAIPSSFEQLRDETQRLFLRITIW